MIECQGVFFKDNIEIPCMLAYAHEGRHVGAKEYEERKHGIVYRYFIQVEWVMTAD